MRAKMTWLKELCMVKAGIMLPEKSTDVCVEIKTRTREHGRQSFLPGQLCELIQAGSWGLKSGSVLTIE